MCLSERASHVARQDACIISGVRILSCTARKAATSSDKPMPNTQAVQPRRSKSWVWLYGVAGRQRSLAGETFMKPMRARDWSDLLR
jgi:hypothetical protein